MDRINGSNFRFPIKTKRNRFIAEANEDGKWIKYNNNG